MKNRETYLQWQKLGYSHKAIIKQMKCKDVNEIEGFQESDIKINKVEKRKETLRWWFYLLFLSGCGLLMSCVILNAKG